MTTTRPSGSEGTASQPALLGSEELTRAMPNSTSTGPRIKRLHIRAAAEVIVETDKPRSMKGPDGVAAGVRNQMWSAATAKEPWPLYFFGPPGRGKTMAALCLLDRCYLPYQYYTTKSLRDLIIVAQQGRETAEYPYGIHENDVWKSIRQANIVVLYELGVSDKVSDHHYDAVVGVLDAREFKPLVIISNVTPDELKQVYDDRIWSRACCGTIVDFSGYPDRRIASTRSPA